MECVTKLCLHMSPVYIWFSEVDEGAKRSTQMEMPHQQSWIHFCDTYLCASAIFNLSFSYLSCASLEANIGTELIEETPDSESPEWS